MLAPLEGKWHFETGFDLGWVSWCLFQMQVLQARLAPNASDSNSDAMLKRLPGR
jgi:hypothetical protein